MTAVAYQEPGPDQCRCYLGTKPSDGAEWWRPDLDEDPGPPVHAVARVGEDSTMRRAIRTDQGWVARLQHGGRWIAAERELDGDGPVLEERLHGRRGQQ